jgi:hypothetical protein
MNRRARIIFLSLSLIALLIVGWLTTGSFEFTWSHFWFTSGLFLLLLTSLIDQPFFSKDNNVFINGITAATSLLLVDVEGRKGVWWIFIFWSLYLVFSSYVFMLIRSKKLSEENPYTAALSRINYAIGRPESIFSALFIWGAIRQFGLQSEKFDALLLYWAAFTILNIPAISKAISRAFERATPESKSISGILLRVINPDVYIASIPTTIKTSVIGYQAKLSAFDKNEAAIGVVIDDRIVSGQRLAKIAVIENTEHTYSIGEATDTPSLVEYTPKIIASPNNFDPVSVVDVGTTIEILKFFINPKIGLQEGQVLWVEMNAEIKAYYQVVSAEIKELTLEEGNAILNICVSAYQLGIWDDSRCRFSPTTWVPPAGSIVHRARFASETTPSLPASQSIVGSVPNSNFPVHVNIDDLVTHNSAIIGVTGSGKSYLSFHLIEEMVRNGIKVLILDLSRQHFIFLSKNQTLAQLRKADDVKNWLESDTAIGIHQFGIDGTTYPATTCAFVEKAFEELSKSKLSAGVNHPAKLCVVLEEAHSLIPEWNQVAIQSDVQMVNKTARIILQGRKYGMGSLIITQRTANVTKTILNQCNTIFALQSFDQTGLDFLRNYMGEGYAGTISTLPARNAIIVGKASSSTRPVLFTISDYSARWNNEEPSAPSPVEGEPS